MKKMRVFLKTGVIVFLTFVLIAVSVSAPTFSWFIRPNGSSGNALTYQIPYKDASGADENMVAYDGSGVTMATYVSYDDGVTFSGTAAPPATSGTLGTQPYDFNNPQAQSNRVYYKTTLTNNHSSPQNVSLYIKNFKTGSTGNVCVGVNVPIKAFKNYSQYGLPKPDPSKNASSSTDKRIYFQTDEAFSNWKPSEGGFRVYYAPSNVSSSSSYKQLTICPGRTNMYYADLPSDANQAFFTSKNSNGSISYQRSQTFTNLSGDGLSSTQSLLFKIADWYDKTYNNVHIDVEKTTGAYITEYYSTATLGKGESLDLGLPSTQYGGGTLAYSFVSGNSNISLNTSTGAVTGTAAGTAKIRYSVQSQHSDTVYKECTITVKDYSSGSDTTIQAAPIVTNLLIPGTNANASSNDHNNVQDVYWFIQNGDEMYGAADKDAHYQLDEIYLGL